MLDRHGGPVSSSIARSEPLVAGALLAVGDAASSANLLGGEGIRHAMDSADQLADLLIAEGMPAGCHDHGLSLSRTDQGPAELALVGVGPSGAAHLVGPR